MSNGIIGPKLAGMQYRVVRALGSGAGSSILLIAEAEHGRKYALKVVKRQSTDDDIYVAQASHEYEVAQRLNHKSLLRIFDCRIKKSWFKVAGVELLMEYVDGKVLDDLHLHDRGQIALIFIHVASAMNHMHRRGVYHADLKPGNIMLSRSGNVKVIDFGTAWIKGQPKDRIQGTPQYMAPEQMLDRVVDERTDLYNFGATLYRLLTGNHANTAGVSPDFQAILGSRGRPESPARVDGSIPVALSDLVMDCIEPSPDRRPEGMFEVKRRLVEVARLMGLKPEDLRGSEEVDH